MLPITGEGRSGSGWRYSRWPRAGRKEVPVSLFRKEEPVRSEAKAQTLAAMEEFIEQRGITEMAEFAATIRKNHPDWHELLVENAAYFKEFFWSRHRMDERRKEREEAERARMMREERHPSWCDDFAFCGEGPPIRDPHPPRRKKNIMRTADSKESE